MYVFQRDSTGKIDPIFPNNQILSGVTNPVQPSWAHEAPLGQSWAFLDKNTGVEKMFIMVSTKPKRSLEALFPYFIDAGHKIGLGTWKVKRVKQTGPVKKVEEFDLPPMLAATTEITVSTRGLGGVAPAEAEQVNIQGQATSAFQPTRYKMTQTEFVQTLWFHHVE